MMILTGMLKPLLARIGRAFRGRCRTREPSPLSFPRLRCAPLALWLSPASMTACGPCTYREPEHRHELKKSHVREVGYSYIHDKKSQGQSEDIRAALGGR